MLNRITLILILLAQFSWAQTEDRDFEKELNYQSKAVKDLKNEIETNRKKLRSEENREKSAARNIANLEEEISLVERLIAQLKKEEASAKHEIANLENEIAVNENELKELRLRYANRAIHVYKKGSLSDIEKVLSSTSWRQAIYRTKYQKIISGIDKQHKQQIHTLLVSIGEKKLNVEAILRKSISLKAERENQMADLRVKRQQKKRELEKIRNNKTELAQYIKEKETGVKQLEELIGKIKDDKARAERAERIRRQQEALKTKSFAALKGQLSWPTEGKVISKFGRKWNPELKTTTDNTGIDIKGKPGTPIYTVMGGIVTTITFIRGYGNIIIIDHGGDFFTIYSHVTKIQTNVDSEVRAGDLLAYMGDSGSINGSKLHFEIWGKDQKLDPEKWLVKK
ncbi:MAG: peptidoglycan DD-metalloendopeptidase family protein [Candidatus Marinimicrobia bacterium]|nr:peptidoglycan DD-metalloendopeptidase family protein [Candidatus Neomarinimicrobiota bacterium]